MESLWIPVAGKFVLVDLTISENTFEISSKKYHLVEHDNSGFKYLATKAAIKRTRKESKQVAAIMDTE